MPPLFGARHVWLSITPEPERELPDALAALRGSSVVAERERVEKLVLRGSRRAWNAYLSEALELARNVPPSDAREVVLDVIKNHDNLKMGLE